MTEDWRKALDNNKVWGIVFVDLKNRLIPYLILYFFKSYMAWEALEISGCGSRITSASRHQVTVVNGCCSSRQVELLSVFHKVLCALAYIILPLR